MRTLLLLSLSLILGFAAHAADMTGELIFPLQDKHVHGSSIAAMPNGDLYAAWFHGSGERSANDVVIQGAYKAAGADAWGPVSTYADTPNLPDCNPVLHVDDDGRLWLFWIVVQANRWEHSILKWTRASTFANDGTPIWEWQDIILLQLGDAFADQLKAGFESLGYDPEMWAEYARAYPDMLVNAAKDQPKRDTGWMTRTSLVALDSGRWILPVYSDGFNVSLMAISDDQGATWTASAPIVGLGNIQPAVVEQEDGTLVAYMRDNGNAPKRIIRSESHDDGDTWTAGTDIELPNPGASVAAITLADGTWIMAYNDTEDGRHSLVAARSNDGGKSWKKPVVLDRAEEDAGNFGYPAIVEAADGTVHITYSYKTDGGASIKHVALK